MLRYYILYIFSLVVGFVAAQDDRCFDTCDTRAASAAGCPGLCAYIDTRTVIAAGCSPVATTSCVCEQKVYQSTGRACIKESCPQKIVEWESIISQHCDKHNVTITIPVATSTTPTASSSALKNACVAGVIGALAALVSIAIF